MAASNGSALKRVNIGNSDLMVSWCVALLATLSLSTEFSVSSLLDLVHRQFVSMLVSSHRLVHPARS
jgi:hypothetical protein